MAKSDKKKQPIVLALVIILVLLIAAFSVYYYQTRVQIGRLQAGKTFTQSVVLLPKTNVILPPCNRTGCASENSWTWTFPQNMSLRYPGYLNITVYYSNNTVGFISASWYYNDSKGLGSQQWDYAAGTYPRTTPDWMIVPVVKGMVGPTLSISSSTAFTTEQSISISYYY